MSIGAAEEGVALQHARAAIGQRDVAVLEPAHRPRRRVAEAAAVRGGRRRNESPGIARDVAAALRARAAARGTSAPLRRGR